MMKIALNKLIRDEKGQALILAMILMLVGSLIIAPLLGFMSTGLVAGQVFEERMDELYAADAGVEDALHKMMNGDASLPVTAGDTWPYNIAAVNDKGVGVEIVLEENVESFLEGLLEKDAGVHQEWAASSGNPVGGIYEITVTYSGAAEDKKINGVGAWLQGAYDIRYYEEGHPKEGEPVYYGDLIDDYPNYTFEVRPYGGGTAFTWEWTDVNRPVFSPGDTKSLTFEFTPAETPGLNFSWLVGGSMDIGVVPEGIVIEVWKVTAIATDSTTGKETEVTAYVSREGLGTEEEPYTVGIITWEISLQQE